MARVQSLNAWCPELELPIIDEDLIDELIRDLCRTCRSFQDLQRSDWLGMLQSRFDLRHRRGRVTKRNYGAASLQPIQIRQLYLLRRQSDHDLNTLETQSLNKQNCARVERPNCRA